jgi:hypothetical protein
MRAQHEWETSMIFTSSSWRVGFVVLAFLLTSTAMAQAPDQQTVTPDQWKLRQPTSSSVQQPDAAPDIDGKRNSETERRMREADRRLNRVMRSICDGC